MSGLEYVRLGRRGPRISVIGLGFWQAGSRLWSGRSSSVLESIRRGVGVALEHGVNFFDTAEIYGWGFSERFLGSVLREYGVLGEVVVASKVAGFRATRYSILRAGEGIKRRLGVDAVDLVQYHWPPPFHARLCSVVRGLEDLVERGVARYIGVSNFPRGLLERAIECTRRFEIVSNQVQYSLAYRVVENGLKGFMERAGLGLIAWGPLAKGALAGRTSGGGLAAVWGDRVFWRAARDRVLQDALGEVASRRGASRAQVALAWLIRRGAVPIPGFRRWERVVEYVGAAGLRLGEEDLRLLDRASEKYVWLYGRCYSSLRGFRFVPSFLQWLAIRGMGGV